MKTRELPTRVEIHWRDRHWGWAIIFGDLESGIKAYGYHTEQEADEAQEALGRKQYPVLEKIELLQPQPYSVQVPYNPHLEREDDVTEP